MNELDKIALEVADSIPTVATYDWTEDDVKEFAHSLVARLSEGQEPVKFEFQDLDGKWYPFMDEHHYKNTVEDGSWPIRALYLHPPLRKPDDEVLEAMRQAHEAMAQLYEAETAHVFDTPITNLRAAIERMEQAAPAVPDGLRPSQTFDLLYDQGDCRDETHVVWKYDHQPLGEYCRVSDAILAAAPQPAEKE